jgi:hypothetical protein
MTPPIARVDDRYDAAVIAGHVMADADRDQLGLF